MIREARDSRTGAPVLHGGFLLLLAANVAGCVALPRFSSGGERPQDSASANDELPVVAFEARSEPEPLPDPATALFMFAEARFQQGHYADAAAAYTAYLDMEPPLDDEAGALWGLAMVHVLPASPLHDHRRAMQLFGEVAERFPERPVGVQARWLRELHIELNRTRALLAEHEQLVARLNDVLEQLKQIDLTRRPVPPADAVPPGGRGPLPMADTDITP